MNNWVWPPGYVRDACVLHFCKQLHQGFPERRHNMCRVMVCQSTDDHRGRHPNFILLVVERHKQQTNILGLCEVFVESFSKVAQDSDSDIGL